MALTLSLMLKLPPRIGASICSMKFLPPEVALYFDKSTIRSCMKYSWHAWAGALSCYLELLYNLQKQISRTVGPSLAASLEPLTHCRNVASLSYFCKYYLQSTDDGITYQKAYANFYFLER